MATSVDGIQVKACLIHISTLGCLLLNHPASRTLSLTDDIAIRLLSLSNLTLY